MSSATRPARPGRRAVRLERPFALVYALGALVHVYFVLRTPEVYESFADLALVDVAREAWTTLVVPNLSVLVPLVAAFEAAIAVGFARGGRFARPAHALGAAFQVGIAPFGPWAPVNLVLAGLHAYLFRARGSRIAASPSARDTGAS